MPETKRRWPWRRGPKAARQGRHAGPAPAPVDPYAAGSMLPDLTAHEQHAASYIGNGAPEIHHSDYQAAPFPGLPAKTPGPVSGHHYGLPLPAPGVPAPTTALADAAPADPASGEGQGTEPGPAGTRSRPGPAPDGAGSWRAAYDVLAPAEPPRQILLTRLGSFIRVHPWQSGDLPAVVPEQPGEDGTLYNFTGSYTKPTEHRATLQTYRDDNGAHLLVMLHDENTQAHIKLSDSECERLGQALLDNSRP